MADYFKEKKKIFSLADDMIDRGSYKVDHIAFVVMRATGCSTKMVKNYVQEGIDAGFTIEEQGIIKRPE